MANFLSDYLIYTAENEAPSMFHLWSGYAALSAAIGRRVYLPHGEKNILANIYVLLVGDAGCGKSYATDMAVDLLRALNTVQISASVETVEGLTRYIAGNPNANPPVASECQRLREWPGGIKKETHEILIHANELINFLRVNPEGWTGMLNDIYDRFDKYDYRTKNMGTDYIFGPYVSLLGCIPTDVNHKLQDFDIINTGFARRTFFQHGVRDFDNPHPVPAFTETQISAKARCLDRLREIQTFSGPINQTPASMSWYIEWYKKHSLSLRKRATPSTQGWLASKPIQILKLGMLNSLAMRDSLRIIPEDFEVAVAQIHEMEKSFHLIFGGIGRNELAAVANKVLEHFVTTQEIYGFHKLQTIFFSSFTSGKGISELVEILQYLVATEQLFKQTVKMNNVPTEMWGTELAFKRYNLQ